MSADIAAELKGVGKQYVKYDDTPTLLTGMLRMRSRSRRSRIWAVRGLDFQVPRGGSFGVIGRNGSGKSTTLAMLAGVTAPSEGSITVNGRIAPLLRLGVGFHDELTGRENVYMNGTVLGMNTKEIDRNFDEIVAFAEIDEFIDTPVKFYSSGMQVRLGFASAIAAKPDVLIVDEVLAVGDLGFQARSFARMEQARRDGATLIVVSHNLTAILRLCDEVLVLDRSVPKFLGPTTEALSIFHELMARPTDDDAAEVPVQILEFEVLGADGKPTGYVSEGDTLTYRVHARILKDLVDPVFAVWVWDGTGQYVYGENSLLQPLGPVAAGTELVCHSTFTANLATGSYYAGAGVGFGASDIERVLGPERPFYVNGRPTVGGFADLHADFKIDKP